MKSYPVNSIPPDSYFSQPVYLDRDFILAAPEMRFSAEMIRAVETWGFDTVTSEGEPRKRYTEESSGEAVFGDCEYLNQAEQFYQDFKKSAEEFFQCAAEGNRIDFNAATETIRSSLDIVRKNQRYLLRIHKNTEVAENQNYLITHTVWSTIIALIIGMYLKLPNRRLIELGVSALFHEVGMIKLSPEIYLNNRPLSPAERGAILTHPLLSYNLLTSFKFPLPVCIGALEHHERENGSGYPRRLKADKISLYSKIIAVACSYEALSSKRPHREAKDGYTGMLELLKNEGKQYNETVIRALVYSLSIYPIGLYVLLSDGRQGQVVDVNPEKPRFPVVHILGDSTPDGLNRRLETSEQGVRILRPLTREELGV